MQVFLNSNSKDYKTGENLYLNLTNKYCLIDKNFKENFEKDNIKFLIARDHSDFCGGIRQVLSRLETYILLDEISISYDNNVAKNAQTIINVKANKLKNNGIMGGGDQDNRKRIEVKDNFNNRNRKCWLLSLFKMFKK